MSGITEFRVVGVVEAADVRQYLVAQKEYEIRIEFTDLNEERWAAGTCLTYRDYAYFPKDGSLVLRFQNEVEIPLGLEERQQASVARNLKRFFVCTAGVLPREKRLKIEEDRRKHPEKYQQDRDPNFSIFKAGVTYEVTTEFTDYHGRRFLPGKKLKYHDYSFLPYEDGFTFSFDETAIFLQDREYAEREIVNNLGKYFRET